MSLPENRGDVEVDAQHHGLAMRITGNPMAVVAIIAVIGVVVLGALSIGVAYRAVSTTAGDSQSQGE